MIKQIIMFALLICLLSGMCGTVANATASAASNTSAGIDSEQVLVMLHLPPPHYRPDANYMGVYDDNSGKVARHRIAMDLAHLYDLQLVSSWAMPELGIDCYVMALPVDMSAAKVLLLLEQDRRVEWAQPMAVYHALNDHDPGHDPLYPLQPSALLWHLDELHAHTTGRNVRVALIDSGVDDSHPDLTGQLAIKENFVDGSAYTAENHGTAVAGIIAARAGNGVGIEGVAPDARLMALRACWEAAPEKTLCNSFTLGKALNFALMHQAQVINLSLSGPKDRLLQRLLDIAITRGVAVIAAADQALPDSGFPASHPGVIAVADTPFGPKGMTLLLAPGRDIPSTAPGGRWVLVSGASFAAAHVSGLFALLRQLQPRQTVARLRSGILTHAGAIDACASITILSGVCTCSCSPVMSMTVLP